MKLGAFSVSLAVKDIAKSRAFYEKLGFEVTGGNAEQGWLILVNGLTVIGLFQGMFDANILTFNPGWGQDKSALESFTDVRDLREQLVAAGLDAGALGGGESGPGHFTLTDPDGNAILIDQHR